MKQYCRYCAYLTGTDCYCECKKQVLSESTCKKVNKCKNFAFNEMDAFNPEKTYKPQTPKIQPYQLKLFRCYEKRMSKEEVTHYVGKNVEITLDNGNIVKGILDYAHLIAGLDMNVSKKWFVVINNDNLSGIAAFFRYSNVIKIKEIE